MNKRWMFAGAMVVTALTATAATVRPVETDEALVNPGMGLTQYHMAGRMWAYGATIPPGDTLAWFPGVSTVYFRFLWSEIEPQEGVSRWDLIDAIANNWVRDGKQICLRVICCNHTKNACPDFVREAGAKGTWFRYKKHGVPADFPLRWEPIYDDPVFLEKYSNFLKAFAKRYDGNPAVAFVDIGSFGMYGEGHTGGGSHPLDKAETDRITRLHMDLHRRLLPNTQLVISDDVAGSGGQEAEAPLMKYAREHGIGFRDDSIFCMGPATNSYAREGSWTHSHWARNFAPESPVVIEPGHWVSCDSKGTWIKERIVTCIEKHQASYFGIHGFPRPFFEAHKDVLPAINRRLGYRFALLEASWPDTVRPDEPVTIVSKWINRGVSWLHKGASLTWSLVDAEGNVCWSSTDGRFDFKTLDPTLDGVEKPQTVESRCFFGHDEPVLPFDNVARAVRAVGQDPGETYVMLKPGRYRLAVSVGKGDGMPEIALPLEEQIGTTRRYVVGEVMVAKK